MLEGNAQNCQLLEAAPENKNKRGVNSHMWENLAAAPSPLSRQPLLSGAPPPKSPVKMAGMDSGQREARERKK